jgi:hypothetical protein
MKASPAERARPDRGPVLWHPAFGVVAWAVYLVSLVAVYLIAFGKHSHACQSASVWAMAISLAIALVTLPVASARLYARPWPRSADLRASRAFPVIVAGLVLAAGSVAVIWTAINLTIAQDPAGAWALAVPAAAAPIAFLVSVLTGPVGGGPAESVEATVEAPPVPLERKEPQVPEPEAKAVEAEPASAEPETAEPQAEPAEAETKTEPEPEPAKPEPETAEPQAEPAEAETKTEPEKQAIPERVTAVSTGLLSADWQQRMDSGVKVVLDSAFWRKTMKTLAEQSTELGGLALTVRAPDALLIIGIVFPKQISANTIRCVFPTVELDRVRRAIDAIAEEVGIAPGDITITWVHTHPGMGVWLSGIDQDTTRSFRALDPDFTPIVIDPHESSLKNQIGVFDSASEKIGPLDLVEGLVNRSASARLARSLSKTYRDDGLAPPIILLPGAATG